MSGHIRQPGCSCCGTNECDTCCDCVPSSVSVVLSGVHASVNGTWSASFNPSGTTCRWIYDDANVTITVASDFDVTAVDKSGPTTRFTGNNTVDHKGACKRIETNAQTNTVGGGTGTATVTGSCTPGCDAEPCAETWDPPVDAVPCTGCDCPSCIPDSIEIVLSGITDCVGQCCSSFGASIKLTAISVSSSFSLARQATSECRWGAAVIGPSGQTVVGTASYTTYFLATDCTGPSFNATENIGASVWVTGAGALRIVIQGINSANLYFDGTLSAPAPCSTGAVFTNNNSSCCGGTISWGYGGTATFSPC